MKGRYDNYLRFVVCLLFVFMMTIITGCSPDYGAKRIMYQLKKDNLPQGEDYNSIVIWRLCIEDKTKTTKIVKLRGAIFEGHIPKFFISGPENLKIGEIYPIHAGKHLWSVKNDIAYYEGTYIAKAIPGNFKFFKLYMPMSLVCKPDTREWINIPLNIKFRTPPNKLIYLGTIYVNNLQLVSWKKDPTFGYRLSMDKEGIEIAKKQFKKQFPKLSKKFVTIQRND